MESGELKPEVTQLTFLNLQVCVPGDYTDQMVEAFANAAEPCGTTNGWRVRKGDTKDWPERNPCASRTGCVHIVLDC